mmetsp:Transcript_129408/g.307044  ORF Transcript_129408/g.307044 Transcript_129408/m.307044 type:complete len:319 (+) Transcript_129408:440-1396(+)
MALLFRLRQKESQGAIILLMWRSGPVWLRSLAHGQGSCGRQLQDFLRSSLSKQIVTLHKHHLRVIEVRQTLLNRVGGASQEVKAPWNHLCTVTCVHIEAGPQAPLDHHLEGHGRLNPKARGPLLLLWLRPALDRHLFSQQVPADRGGEVGMGTSDEPVIVRSTHLHDLFGACSTTHSFEEVGSCIVGKFGKAGSSRDSVDAELEPGSVESLGQLGVECLVPLRTCHLLDSTCAMYEKFGCRRGDDVDHTVDFRGTLVKGGKRGGALDDPIDERNMVLRGHRASLDTSNGSQLFRHGVQAPFPIRRCQTFLQIIFIVHK